MIDYYKALNLSLAKQKGIITDEMVEKNYLAKRQQYLAMKEAKKLQTKDINLKSEELAAFLEDDYLTLLEDAYYALSSDNARKHYDELMEKIKEHIEQQRKNKYTNINFEKMVKQTTTLDTKQLLDKIKQEAKEKYPIPGIDDDIMEL